MSASNRKSHKKSEIISSNKKSNIKLSCSSVTKKKLIDFLLKAAEL